MDTDKKIPGIIRQELAPRGKVLWSKQPRQGIILRFSDLYIMHFSLFWSGGVFFGIYIAVTTTLKASLFY